MNGGDSLVASPTGMSFSVPNDSSVLPGRQCEMLSRLGSNQGFGWLIPGWREPRYDPCVGPPSVIILEFNELSPRLMDRFIAEGQLPNFERFRNASTVAITDPEEPQDKLNPWVQWVTLHTGVPRSEHGIEKLGEAESLEHKTIGEVVSSAGRSVWICGTMNLPSRTAQVVGAYLPDPWNPKPAPRPASLAHFNDFVRANVQEHTNAAARLSAGSAARFGWFMVRHGLSWTTISVAARQLIGERRSGPGRWARASVLDRMQWDLFRWRLRHDRPVFATFFSNSTAHYQHLYWRNLEPDIFLVSPTDEEQAHYRDAVLHGYRAMDALVAEALDLSDELGSTLMLCTALSQQPYVHADEVGGKHLYRPHDFTRLLDTLGVHDSCEIAPVMAEQFRAFFDSETGARFAAEQLSKATVSGQPVLSAQVEGNAIFVGCTRNDVVPEDALIRDARGAEHPFFDLFYRFETAKSGYHHPDGMWWTRTGSHRELDEKVSLRSVAPTILRLLGVEPPGAMKAAPIDVVGVTAGS